MSPATDRPRLTATPHDRFVRVEGRRTLPGLVLVDEPVARAHFPGHVLLAVAELQRNAEACDAVVDLTTLSVSVEVEHLQAIDYGAPVTLAHVVATAEATPRELLR